MSFSGTRLGRTTCALLAGAAAAAALVLSAGPAAAQVYEPAGEPSLSTAAPAPGEALTVSGGGFGSGTLVRAVIFSEPVVLGTATANAAGEVDLSVAIPESFAAGSEHRIELQGVDSSGDPRVLAQEITLAGGSGGLLASTGAAVIPLVSLAGVLLLGGGLLIATGRTRRRATTS